MAKKEGAEEKPAVQSTEDKIIVKSAVRRKLPRVRNSRTYRFVLSDLEGFFTVGEYDDGTPGELFVNVSKQGSTLSGVMDSLAISISHGLQYGVPLKSYVKGFRGTSFAPSGATDDKEIRTASSITDYIFRRLALDYLSFDDRLELGLASLDDMPDEQTSLLDEVETPKEDVIKIEKVVLETIKAPEPIKSSATSSSDDTAPLCYSCGNQTQRAGSCYVCTACGSTTGCS
jgi:ribonucleoside-diphosphate reductase alpha chain